SLSEDDSGSQVVALEEGEETDEAAATVAGGAVSDELAEVEGGEAEDVDELLAEEAPAEVEEGEEAEEVTTRRAPAVAAAPAHWGWVPAVFMAPCVLVMFLLALMSFELVHGMWGYKQTYRPTSFVTNWVASIFGAEPEEGGSKGTN